MNVIDRLPQTGSKGIYLKQPLQDKLIEHKHYINANGKDMPEILNWKWKKLSAESFWHLHQTAALGQLGCQATGLNGQEAAA